LSDHRRQFAVALRKVGKATLFVNPKMVGVFFRRLQTLQPPYAAPKMRRGKEIPGLLKNADLQAAQKDLRPSDNFIRALRLSSGRTDKYLNSNEASPFVVSFVEP